MMVRNVEHTYVVIYDIAKPKRWRRIYKTMKAYGEWLQLSVFQCRLSSMKREELLIEINEELSLREDSFMIMDLGPADTVEIKVETLGKHEFRPVKREAHII